MLESLHMKSVLSAVFGKGPGLLSKVLKTLLLSISAMCAMSQALQALDRSRSELPTGVLSPLEEGRGLEGPVAQVLEFSRDDKGYLALLRSISFDARGRPVLERSYDGDAQLRGVINRDYDENGRLISVGGRNSQGQVLWTYRYFHDEKGRVLIEESLNSNGALEYRIRHQYSENKRVHRAIRYGPDDLPSIEDSCQYDERGVPVSRMILYSDHRLLKRELYFYDSLNRIVVIERHDSRGLYEREEFTYDELERLAGTKLFGPDNSLKERVRFVRQDDGKIVEERVLGPDGSVRSSREYQYDTRGNWVSMRSRDGAVLFREYVYQEQKRGR